jgi:hypothetical protein
VFFLATIPFALVTGCGSSSGAHTQPSTPVFTSVPATAATQGVAYTVQLAAVDPAGGSVTFSLPQAPTGAALSGSTVTWTPTAAQSRVSNSFMATATTASGGTASQSWTVMPGGTITVNWVNTYWTENGQVQVPEPSSEALNISALVTNTDGSITVEKSSATSPGVFSIPNVPGGYYWLETPSGAYWTSASAFDAGRNMAGDQEPILTTPTSQITNFDLNLSGLESVPQTSFVELSFPFQLGSGFAFGVSANSTTLTGTKVGFEGDIDWSRIESAFLSQYVPATLGSLNNYVLGSTVEATGLSLTNGATYTLTETLQTGPQASFDVSVPGASQWSGLFANAGPAAATPHASALSVSAQPYVSGINAGGLSLSLASTAVPSQSQSFLSPPTASCDATGFDVGSSNSNSSFGTSTGSTAAPAQAAITTDEDFGTLQYADPFDSSWTRSATLCQEYTVAIPAGTGATANFALVDSVTVPVSTTAAPSFAPLVSPVLSPTINSANFFTAAALNTATIPLSWTAPATGTPFGYAVRVYVLSTLAGASPTYAAAGTFNTAQTSITLPPLSGGNTYVFTITAEADATAKVETGPFRSSLPTGSATVVSAPITINTGALTPAIHGDRRVIAQLSQTQPASGPRPPLLTLSRSGGQISSRSQGVLSN